VTAGARPALPGEFTERAVLNGKLDLISAEAIGELIDARTRATHRAAIQVLSGTLARQYAELRRDAIAVEALIAYDIDFPEEDHGPVARERVDTAAATVEAHLGSLLATTPAVVLGRDGALVVLAGPPNAGKSSLLNALVGESRVIVSDEPGTTRDAIEVLLDTDPWPIRLVDTAGLREDAGVVERLGIEVCERYLKGADVVVVCAETENGLATAAARVRTLTDAPIIEVHTKGDLRRRNGKPGPDAILEVSAINGWRLDALRERILDVIVSRVGRPDDLAPPVASARQRAALDIARNEMVLFRSAWREGTLPAPVAATHLRAAVDALDHLIGVVDSNDVLDRVFSTFCVGK
jgi:tRNA modification GTPase